MKLSSLFRKTLLCQTLLFGAVVGSLSLTSAYSLRWYLAGEYASRGSAVAYSIAGSANELLADQDTCCDVLPTLLAEFSNLQGVAYVLVADAEGQLLAHTFGDTVPGEFESGRFVPGNHPTPDSPDSKFRRFTDSPNFETAFGQAAIAYRRVPDIGYIIDIALPIRGETEGYVHVGMDQVRMIQQIRSAASLQLWVTLILLILSIVATYAMVRHISQPLTQLTDYAKRLANRDFSSPVSTTNRDEVGLLANTMNSMATDMQTFIQELESTLAELQQTQSQLVQSEKMAGLGQLVAGVAHEINNPISFIACNVDYAEAYAKQLIDLLADKHPDQFPHLTPEQLTPELRKVLEDLDVKFIMTDFPKVLASMRVGTERIQETISSLRSFARLDEAEFKSVDIHKGMDSALMILNRRSSSLGPQKLAVVITKDYGDLGAIPCYAGQLNQVFFNILTNALDAMSDKQFIYPERPQIRISTAIKGELVEIRIQDNGCGVEPSIMPRVFDPFFTTKPVGQGSGLGLAISYQVVVERHQGILVCQSSPSHGTTFRIQIPRNAGETRLLAQNVEAIAR